MRTDKLKSHREIIAVCSEIHTKHINTLCGQNVGFLNVKVGGTQNKIVKVCILSVTECSLYLVGPYKR